MQQLSGIHWFLSAAPLLGGDLSYVQETGEQRLNILEGHTEKIIQTRERNQRAPKPSCLRWSNWEARENCFMFDLSSQNLFAVGSIELLSSKGRDWALPRLKPSRILARTVHLAHSMQCTQHLDKDLLPVDIWSSGYGHWQKLGSHLPYTTSQCD